MSRRAEVDLAVSYPPNPAVRGARVPHGSAAESDVPLPPTRTIHAWLPLWSVGATAYTVIGCEVDGSFARSHADMGLCVLLYVLIIAGNS